MYYFLEQDFATLNIICKVIDIYIFRISPV